MRISFCVVAFVKFGAQLTDIDIDNIGQALEALIPDMLDYHGARQNAPRIERQIFEQGVFLAAQLDALVSRLTLCVRRSSSKSPIRMISVC